MIELYFEFFKELINSFYVWTGVTICSKEFLLNIFIYFYTNKMNSQTQSSQSFPDLKISVLNQNNPIDTQLSTNQLYNIKDLYKIIQAQQTTINKLTQEVIVIFSVSRLLYL